jgi:hypothetical protein
MPDLYARPMHYDLDTLRPAEEPADVIYETEAESSDNTARKLARFALAPETTLEVADTGKLQQVAADVAHLSLKAAGVEVEGSRGAKKKVGSPGDPGKGPRRKRIPKPNTPITKPITPRRQPVRPGQKPQAPSGPVTPENPPGRPWRPGRKKPTPPAKQPPAPKPVKPAKPPRRKRH